MKIFKKKERGFTLIELLVVVAIIGLLASVVLASLNSARIKGRDAKRKEDLHSIQIALGIYFSVNGTFPNCGYWVQSTDVTWNTTGCLITALKPYIPILPVDSVNTPVGSDPWVTGSYIYAYGFDPALSQDYDLVAQLENTGDANSCQYRKWTYHHGGMSWCPTYSNYMYADH
jgi:prepilin-type N-terminal cleavage/methylation domain-containing protein